MQIPPHIVQLNTSAMDLRDLPLRAGQRLEAVVVRGAVGAQAAQVRMAGVSIELRLPVKVETGARLTFAVVERGGRAALQLLAHTPPAPPGAQVPPQRGHPMSAWLPSLLPAQGGQAPLFAQLTSLVQKPVPGLPADVAAAARALIDMLPTPAQVFRPEGLREAINRSGLFHEAVLAVAASDLNARSRLLTSLKSALLSLAARLRAHSTGVEPARPVPSSQPPPPRPGAYPIPQARAATEGIAAGPQPMLYALRDRVEQAVARLVLHQWSSSEANESGLPRWLFELPLRNGNAVDILHCVIEAERERKGRQRERIWHAEIALDTPGLGPVHARVTVTGNNVSVRFWVLDSDQADPLRAALHHLGDALRAHQLNVRNLGCFAGPPPRHYPPHAGRSGVLDDRA